MSKPTTTQEQLEPGEPTIGEVLRWLEKLELLSGEGAKVLHVKNLLTTVIETTRKETAKAIFDALEADNGSYSNEEVKSEYLTEREEKK